MLKDKVYYIHYRKYEDDGSKSCKGGYSFAWYMDLLGNIVVSNPAICDERDTFVKETGRDLSKYRLLMEKDVFFTIKNEDVMKSAVDTLKHNLKGGYLISSIEDILDDYLKLMVQQNGINQVMSLTFFDNLVRDCVAYSVAFYNPSSRFFQYQ